MFSLPSIFAFVLPLPALDRVREIKKRQRAIATLRLSPHILKDVGLDDVQVAADDLRWSIRPDLER
jgi:hypothetical protein